MGCCSSKEDDGGDGAGGGGRGAVRVDVRPAAGAGANGKQRPGAVSPEQQQHEQQQHHQQQHGGAALPPDPSRSVLKRWEDVRAHYAFDKVLGRGQFGVTRLVVHRATGERAACKSISKRK